MLTTIRERYIQLPMQNLQVINQYMRCLLSAQDYKTMMVTTTVNMIALQRVCKLSSAIYFHSIFDSTFRNSFDVHTG